MLTSIHIQNFALIDQLELSLSNGLTILTGETGAGKSIILGALGLLQGNRADLSVVRDKTVKCIVEAEFDLSRLNLKSYFEQNDLDYDQNSYVRREILPSGKSRAFINDSPVNLSVLSGLGSQLIDIHSQHQTLKIANDSFQRSVLDAFVGAQTLNNQIKFETVLGDYRSVLKDYKIQNRQLLSLEKQKSELLKELDYNTFLLNELEEIDLDAVDEDALENELNQLSNVESIENAFNGLIAQVSSDDNGILDQLREHKNNLQIISSYSTSYKDIWSRVQSVIIELEDIYTESENLLANVSSDPERINQLSDQLNTLNTLYKKHQLQNVDELKELRDQLATKVLDSQGVDRKIVKVKKLISELQNQLNDLGKDLFGLRESHKAPLETAILKTAHSLGMPDAVFKIEIATVEDFNNYGKDEVRFMFSANKGSDLQELDKAASGGELSRLMLGIKSILSDSKQLPTIIFDEIDTGVSGRIADKMASMMQRMSEGLQVITITHLPQIAAAGKDHLVVEKKVVNDRTVSSITKLSKKQRVEEIAQMLSGGEVSDAARKNARILLN
ncbi:MAG: DNA repair protein RecN [Nonlabens sp.]